MTLQKNGFTAEEVDTPQTVFCMTERGQPGRPGFSSIGAVVFGQNAPDHISVNVETERQVNLLRNPGTAESWIALPHGGNGIDQFFGRSLGSGFSRIAGKVKEPVFSSLEGIVESQQR